MSKSRNEIQRHSRSLGMLSTVVFFLMLLALCVEAGALLRGGALSDAAMSGLIFRLPLLFYLLAIWKMRQAYAALAKGAMFGDVVPPLLTWIGLALSAGALMTVVGVPLLDHLTIGIGGLVNYDPAAIVLGIVGLMLAILARLLTQAANMRAELEEFF